MLFCFVLFCFVFLFEGGGPVLASIASGIPRGSAAFRRRNALQSSVAAVGNLKLAGRAS